MSEATYPQVTVDFTATCHVCGVHTEHVGGTRVDDRCGHVLGQVYGEAEYARARVQRFLDTWLGTPEHVPADRSGLHGSEGRRGASAAACPRSEPRS